MKKLPSRIEKIFALFFRSVPENLLAQYKAICLDVNVQRMYGLSVYVIILQIVLQIINVLRPADVTTSNIIVYIILSLITLTIGIIYLVLFTLIRRKKILSYSFIQFAVQSFLYIYVAIQLAFCTLNIMSDGGADSYYIAILLVGLVPIISHRQTIITILLAFVYVLCVYTLVPANASAWDSIMLTDVWANLIIITALTCAISVFTNNLFIANFIQGVELSVELSAYNRELFHAAKKLEQLATVDELTGLQNRHSLSLKLDFLWHLSVRSKRKITLAMFDIDYFKSYNDAFGHPAGDECLKKISLALSNSFRRKDDIVCRWGGEEFLVVLASSENPFELIDAARQNIEALQIQHAKKTTSQYVTVSGGMCTLIPTKSITANQVIKAADAALYESKNKGRNKITQTSLDE